MWETPQVSFIFPSQAKVRSGCDETRNLTQVTYNFTHLYMDRTFLKILSIRKDFLSAENSTH